MLRKTRQMFRKPIAETLEARRLLAGVVWTQVLVDVQGSAGDWFGYSVAVQGETTLVGIPYDGDNGVNSGGAMLMNVTTGARLAKLKPNDGTAYADFGSAVALHGNTALIGARGGDEHGADSGAVYVFNAATGAQVRKINAADGGAMESFGLSIALWGDIALIGCPNDDDNGTDSGSAYLHNVSTGLWSLAPSTTTARVSMAAWYTPSPSTC